MSTIKRRRRTGDGGDSLGSSSAITINKSSRGKRGSVIAPGLSTRSSSSSLLLLKLTTESIKGETKVEDGVVEDALENTAQHKGTSI